MAAAPSSTVTRRPCASSDARNGAIVARTAGRSRAGSATISAIGDAGRGGVDQGGKSRVYATGGALRGPAVEQGGVQIDLAEGAAGWHEQEARGADRRGEGGDPRGEVALGGGGDARPRGVIAELDDGRRALRERHRGEQGHAGRELRGAASAASGRSTSAR